MFVGTFFFITYRLCNKVGKRKVSSSDNMHTYVSTIQILKNETYIYIFIHRLGI